jgi:alkylation response protein AidB-like acyl-CoA dehydrogenase
MTDLEAFRSEARAFLEAKSPAVLRGRPMPMGPLEFEQEGEELAAARKQWLTVMAERGWTAPTWPKEYSGGGLSAREARVLQEELSRLKLPPASMGMGLSMIGPTLLVHGNEEQKRRHLPKIVSGEIRWCQGFSEPNAGSDLASLSTSAKLDPTGEHFVVNGQKVWTSGAQYAVWIFMLVRTDETSKHNGITFLLADMDDPGVEVRPIRLISGNSPFCETFFSDVKVPVENVVGGVDQGWTVAKALLGFERSGMGGISGGPARRAVDPGGKGMIALAKRNLGVVGGRVSDGELRDRMARVLLDQMALQLTVQRAAETRKATGAPGPETSMFKVYTSELGHRRDELMLALRGSESLAWSADDASEGAAVRAWLSAKATTIFGGTSEIQRNIIAKRVLQLPQPK